MTNKEFRIPQQEEIIDLFDLGVEVGRAGDLANTLECLKNLIY